MKPMRPFLLAALLLAAPALAQDSTRVIHSPWLALRIEQDGVQVPLRRNGLLRTDATLAPRPFTLVLPVRGTDDNYRLAASTGPAILSLVTAGPSHDLAKDDSEVPPFFSPYRCMADTAAGSGTLMLNREGHHCLNGLRLGPDRDRHVFHVSQVMDVEAEPRTTSEIENVTGPLFMVVYFDENGDGQPDHGEYELLALNFQPLRR